MAGGMITEQAVLAFEEALKRGEYAKGSVEKYVRDVRGFVGWAGAGLVTAETPAAWKEHLLAAGLQPGTINSMLSALNRFFAFLGWDGFRVRYFRVQRKVFRSAERELTQREYGSLVKAAKAAGRERLALLIETLCATGIRVSEVKYITVEAARTGRANISLKGKIRTILIPGKLCKKLERYAKAKKIVSGEIFLTRNGRGLTRRQIWAEMKGLCGMTGIATTKVFPHNLRHLFARTFYRAYKDVVRLADVLGHASIETTRIYLVSTGAEHARQLERLQLIS